MNDVILTSLLLFKIINVFANFLMFEFFFFEGKIMELDFANKFNNMTS